ncbi:MAG: hypothetical protein KUL88_01960 [Rhizobium sp.]|nr:hypothetical protein [Rhizobium sp.]
MISRFSPLKAAADFAGFPGLPRPWLRSEKYDIRFHAKELLDVSLSLSIMILINAVKACFGHGRRQEWVQFR